MRSSFEISPKTEPTFGGTRINNSILPMIPIIEHAINLWREPKGYARSDIKFLNIKYSDPKIDFHTFSFIAPCGTVMLKVFKHDDHIKLTELT